MGLPRRGMETSVVSAHFVAVLCRAHVTRLGASERGRVPLRNESLVRTGRRSTR